VKAAALRKGLIRPEQAERMSERELVNLVFLPGFSTAPKVSSLSGRGVGMDVVKTNIERIGGAVDLSSRPGQGATVKIRIPLTLAIIPGLVVTSGGERFVIPQVSLLELIRLEGPSGLKQVERIHGAPVYRRRGRLLPLAYLNETLKLREDASRAASDVINIVVLQADDRAFGLVVDGINDTQEIVVKSLGKRLKETNCYAGATIMGDGRVALILDVLGVARLSGVLSEARIPAHAEETQEAASGERQSLLLFRCGSFERLAAPLGLVARLEKIPRSKIERADGRMVVQYRGQILPLIPLDQQLEGSGPAAEQDPAEVIVFADGDRRIGLVVDQILDIAEAVIEIKRPSHHPALLGSAVVGGKVTDFLDLHAAIGRSETNWFESGAEANKSATVLVTEGSSFSRGLLRNYLEMAGHRVIEASNPREALDKLGKGPVDVVVASLDLPDRGAFELLASMRNQPEFAGSPVLALATEGTDAATLQGDLHFSETLGKFDRFAMLRSVDRLAKALDPALSGEVESPLLADTEKLAHTEK
jgi:two-component system chemotaxis sensor kinase CheA